MGTLDFESLRRKMVQEQIVQRGIHDEAVIAAMLDVPRELFVPEHLRDSAYDDCPLPIDCGQTISQPYTVAYMVQELRVTRSDIVLDVGTGSGYAAAVLSRIVRYVYSIERFPELAKAAQESLHAIKCQNVHVLVGDGGKGCPEHSPFHAIIVAAAAKELPCDYRSQLYDGGRIVIPIGNQWQQSLMRYELNHGVLSETNLGAFLFVPLVGCSLS